MTQHYNGRDEMTDERLEKIITTLCEEYGMPKFDDVIPAKEIIQAVRDADHLHHSVKKPTQEQLSEWILAFEKTIDKWEGMK